MQIIIWKNVDSKQECKHILSCDYYFNIMSMQNKGIQT